MRPIIVDLVEYVEQRTVGSTLAPVLENVGDIEVRIVAISLLGWLKDMGRRGKQMPLAFNKKHTWCQNLLILLSDVPQLNELLQVAGEVVDFRDEITANERCEIEEYVDIHYNPKLRT